MAQDMFRISELSFCFLQIPFHERFAHASATRAHSESIWVTITTTEGVIGYGEGCPRKYVSGETLQSAAEFIDVIQDEIKQSIHDLASLREWVDTNRFLIDTNPAAWCALELALLDVIARQHFMSIEELLGITQRRRVFQYSAVLGNSQLKTFARQALLYAQLGFQDYKVKLSGVLSEDRNKLALLQSMHEHPIRIRVDANNLWQTSEEVIAYLDAINTPLFAIEEPVSKDRYDLMTGIAQERQLKMILDESFQRVSQLKNLRDSPQDWIINLRISKLGGLLRTLQVIEQARALAIPLIVGAHVGETSLMTRAGMVVAQAADDALLAQEGGFGTYLLKQDVCDTPLMFGKLGEIQTDRGQLRPIGFGLSIVPP